MYNERNNKSQIEDTERLKEIPKWARKYAQNRTLTNLVNLLIFLLISAGIGVSSVLAGIAFTTGHIIFFWICSVVLFAILICLFYISIPKLGGRKLWRWIDQRIYGQEGTISISEPEAMKKKKWVGHVVGLVFGLCVICSVFLGGKYNIPIKYMQPVSALYAVPFLVFLYFWQRPKVGPISLLWPTLYTIHAILIVAGVPILFTGDLTYWNTLLPVFGYGFLTFTIGHFYSRYALKKLKTTAYLQENNNEQ